MFALLSLIFGGVLRLAPDVIHLFTAKEDHAHELAMVELQQKGVAAEAQFHMQEAQQAGTLTLQGSELQAIIEATKAQATITGVKWIDALSSSVRPVVTYWWMFLLTAFKFTTVLLAYRHNGDIALALHDTWTPEDVNTLSGIIGFWFVDRVRRYQTGK